MMRPQPQPDPRPAVPSRNGRRTPDHHPASIPAPAVLPGWDSFPSADRRLLVDLLVQTACRQIRTRPMPPRAGDRG
jgi:hypothetical protein